MSMYVFLFHASWILSLWYSDLHQYSNLTLSEAADSTAAERNLFLMNSSEHWLNVLTSRHVVAHSSD